METLLLPEISEADKLEMLMSELIQMADRFEFESPEAQKKHQAIKATLFMSYFHTTGKLPS